MKSFKICLFILTVFLFISLCFSQSSLIPDPDLGYPDNTKVNIKRSTYKIHLNNQFLKTSIDQTFKNLSSQNIEALYEFSLPLEAKVTNFATWDNEVRLEGVMLEKSVAKNIYKNLRDQAIDPGLIEQKDSGKFQARIVPILPYATKKLEIEFVQLLKQDLNTIYLPIPFHNSEQKELPETSIYLTIQSDYAKIESIESSLPEFSVKKLQENIYKGFILDTKGLIKDDIGIYIKYAPRESFNDLFFYRENLNSTGYFIFNNKLPASSSDKKRRIVFLIDNSFSMKANEEEFTKKTKEIIYAILHELKSEDEFLIANFNDEINLYSELFLKFSKADIHPVMTFLENINFSGATKLSNALRSISDKLLMNHNSNDYSNFILLLSDGIPNGETVDISNFGILDELKKSNIQICHYPISGMYEPVILKKFCDSTGGFVLDGKDNARISKTFIEKTGYKSITDYKLSFKNIKGVSIELVNPEYKESEAGKEVIFAGSYKGNGKATAVFTWNENGKPFTNEKEALFPSENNSHQFVEFLWASREIERLLSIINKNFSEDIRKKIVNLSKKYNILTPYTAFLAAPKSILRPKFIKPGDPVIKVKAPPGTKKVMIFFPFGIEKECTFNSKNGLFECRFLAPSHLKDGKYKCKLLITLKNGKTITEDQTFYIDNTPPELKCFITPKECYQGDTIKLSALASSDTLKIIATMPLNKKVSLKYNPKTGYSEALYKISSLISPKTYSINITATDRAENVTVNNLDLVILKGGTK